MENTPVSIAVCNQKGGVGKSTFTVLLASHLHYTLQRDVLVVDCDYPQWSIYNQRSRELEILNLSDYHKLMVARQFKGTDRKFWPIVSSTPSDALEKTARQLQSDYHPQIILYDLPGTVNTEGVLQILSSLDALFIPIKADKVVLESSLSLPVAFITAWFVMTISACAASTSFGRWSIAASEPRFTNAMRRSSVSFICLS